MSKQQTLKQSILTRAIKRVKSKQRTPANVYFRNVLQDRLAGTRK